MGGNINTSKTEYLVIGKNPKDLQVGNEVIRCTNKFKYLGSYIALDRTTGKDIKYRITQGKATTRTLNFLLRSSKINRSTKIQL